MARGCTNHRYGDLEITCECTAGCNEDKLTPVVFEKHSRREIVRKWKNNIRVIVNGDKVSLSKTALLKYYNQASKNVNDTNRSIIGRVCHRDEFLHYKKERDRNGVRGESNGRSNGQCVISIFYHSQQGLLIARDRFIIF
ncbi:protein ULTRAPETALA 1-like [Hibiscus syriacus]|uniref:protein ULTRAPETALA 1-like n=1 Tax=Hibiscus syriacus TaxID=106335 RepID=UPI0019208509|nr:protein ULTRAPETALA 1-like [Hibiscus syriacus]